MLGFAGEDRRVRIKRLMGANKPTERGEHTAAATPRWWPSAGFAASFAPAPKGLPGRAVGKPENAPGFG
jgi:hypothetical protein